MSLRHSECLGRLIRAGMLAALATWASAGWGNLVPPADSVDKAFNLASLLREVGTVVSLAGGLDIKASKSSLVDGDKVVFSVDVPRAGYLNVISVDPAGDAVVLFPNAYQTDNKVAPGRFTFPNSDSKFEIQAKAPFGDMTVAAFLTPEPMDIRQLGLGGGTPGGSAGSRFAELTLAARDLINQFASRKLQAGEKDSSLAAGMTTVTLCAKPGPCKATAAQQGGGVTGSVLRIVDAFVPGIFFDVEADHPKALPAKLRRLDERGLKLTKASEGFVRKLYVDVANHCTIAYGHLLKLNGCSAAERKLYPSGITEPDGSILLQSDLGRAQAAVEKYVKINLSDGQYAALVDFTYNVGAGNLQKSTLLKAVNAAQHERVPFQMRRWTMAGGRPLRGLLTRRNYEIALYFDNAMIPKTIPKDEVTSPIDVRQGEAP